MNRDPSPSAAAGSPEPIEIDIPLTFGEPHHNPPHHPNRRRKPSQDQDHHVSSSSFSSSHPPAPEFFHRYRDRRSPSGSIASQDDSTYSTLDGSRASPDRDWDGDVVLHGTQEWGFVDFGVTMEDGADTDWAPTPRGFEGDVEEEPLEVDGEEEVEDGDTTPRGVGDFVEEDEEVEGLVGCDDGGTPRADVGKFGGLIESDDGVTMDQMEEVSIEEEEEGVENDEDGEMDISLEIATHALEDESLEDESLEVISEDESTPKPNIVESEVMIDIGLEEEHSLRSSPDRTGYIDWDPPTPSVFQPDMPEATPAEEEDNGYIDWDAPTPAVFQDEISSIPCDEDMLDVSLEVSESPSATSPVLDDTLQETPGDSPLLETPSITLWKLLENPKDVAKLEDAIINYVMTTLPVLFKQVIGNQLPVHVPGSSSSPRVPARSGQKRTSSSFSQGDGSAYSSNRNTPKKKRKNEEDEDEDEDDSRKRARRNGSPETAVPTRQDNRHYACHYFKHSPARYPDCKNENWRRENIDLAASHIFTHLGPKFCFRCKTRFRDEQSAQRHAEQPEGCSVKRKPDRPSAEDLLIAQDIERELATGSWTWLSLYHLLFPDSDFELSPFHGDLSRKPSNRKARPVLTPVTPGRKGTASSSNQQSPPSSTSRLTGSTLLDDSPTESSENLLSTRNSTKAALPDFSFDSINTESPGTIKEHIRAELMQIVQNDPEFLRALQEPKATQSFYTAVKTSISTGFRKFRDSKIPIKSDARMRNVGTV